MQQTWNSDVRDTVGTGGISSGPDLSLVFREAKASDCGLILFFIRELAAYEKMSDEVIARGCGRLEWSCLDWNKPSIDFYLSLGAKPMEEWTVYRITGETLEEMGR